MKIVKSKIANALTSAAMDHVVVVSNDIYDENLGKYQNEINKHSSGDIDDVKKKIEKEIVDRKTDVKNVNDKLSNEISERKLKDGELNNKILNEISDRQIGDSDLQSKFNMEVSARTQSDSVLQTNINNETNVRIVADATLQTNINDEVNARTQADSVLQGQINTKQDILIAGENIQIFSNVISATDTIYNDSEVRGLISGNTQAIINEVSARTTSDIQLQNEISTKQDILIAGENIQIAPDSKTISATDTVYDDTQVRNLISINTQVISAETIERKNVDVQLQNEIDVKQDILNAGTNIQINGNTISATDTIYDDNEIRGLISGNTQAITNEVSSRTQADAALQAQIEELDNFTCGQIVPTTTNFISGTTYSIEESLQRTANLFSGQQGEINTINSKLGDCTTSNTAADKAFVNSTVATNAANFRGNFTNWSNVPTDVNGYTEDYRGTKTPTNNDYMVVQDATDYASGNTGMWRFMYIGDWASVGKNGWKPQYRVGSAFTAAQQAAIDSGVNSTKVVQYDGYDADITALETDKLDKVYSSGKKVYGVASDGTQKMYTAGSNVQLNDDGTISATDTIYDDSALQAQVTANTAAIATKQDTLTAGTGINISGTTINTVYTYNVKDIIIDPLN